MDVVGWLRRLGLERYEAVFRENEITERVLPSLTAEDLKELGVVALGHRRILFDAISETGLGERSHLLNKDITLDTHITDGWGYYPAVASASF